MPNWCSNELNVQVHPDDADKLKTLMFNSETGDLDFGVACPRPKALDGMMLKDGDSVVFNKELDTRATLLTTSAFITLLRQNNNKREEKLDCPFVRLIRENIDKITDKQILKEEDRNDYDACGEDVFEAELLIINALEKELTSAPCYTPSTPVEEIFEYFLNANKDAIDYNKDSRIANFSYICRAKDLCSVPVQYAISKLDDLYRIECNEAYGARDSHKWNIFNWGVKWNACEPELSEDGKTVYFATAWKPPIEWLHRLAQEVEEKGIRNFIATLKYAEPGDWFGGEFYIDESDNYGLQEFDNEQIMEFLNLEDDEYFEDDEFS